MYFTYINFNIFWGDKFKFLMRFELHLFLGRKGGKKIEKILLKYIFCIHSIIFWGAKSKVSVRFELDPFLYLTEIGLQKWVFNLSTWKRNSLANFFGPTRNAEMKNICRACRMFSQGSEFNTQIEIFQLVELSWRAYKM